MGYATLHPSYFKAIKLLPKEVRYSTWVGDALSLVALTRTCSTRSFAANTTQHIKPSTIDGLRYASPILPGLGGCSGLIKKDTPIGYYHLERTHNEQSTQAIRSRI